MRLGNRQSGGAYPKEPCPPKSLDQLLAGVSYSCLTTIRPNKVLISAVTADSRQVKDSTLFVALAGSKTDGHLFLDQAIGNGCAAIVIEEGKALGTELSYPSLCIIVVQDSRRVYAAIAANFFDHPAQNLTFIGITGTNGKTTITYLLEAVLKQLGLSVGVLGTINYRYSSLSGKGVIAAPFTTPEPLILQSFLYTMVEAGVQYVLMEASSHALLQHRLGDIQFDVAAFTNLSHDHLDYHEDMDEYFAAKTRLFTDYLKKEGTAVITFGGSSQQQDWSVRLRDLCFQRSISCIKVGMSEDSDIRAIQVESGRDGTTTTLATVAGPIRIISPLVGSFNVENILTTMGICQAMGLDLQKAGESLVDAHGAPGRLQPVFAVKNDNSRPLVFVDYAHTPDALQKVLMTLAALPHRNLFCVFGCGGDRDVQKRPVMGKIAAEISDAVIVTDDNPRSESSSQIIEQILPGIIAAGLRQWNTIWLRQQQRDTRGFVVIPAREQAIAVAVQAAGPDDIVLIAGKGHEKYQIGPNGKRFFDDCLEAQEALISWNCASISEATTGTFNGAIQAPSFNVVSTDSRTIAPGDIFLALKGENFDGHDFLPQAIAAGAGCVVVSKDVDLNRCPDIPIFLVKDTQVALGELAGYRRRLLRSIQNPLVLGITGSCGKTTVKEMTAAIFQQRWPDGPDAPAGRVIKTRGNFNNLIGLPLSLLPLGIRHSAVILEMGMNHPGEIADLVRIADPDISCIVSIHAAHLEGLGSLARVADAKEELFAGTKKNGTLIFNLDDEHIRAMIPKYGQKKITYSAGELAYGPDLWASAITPSRTGTTSYILHLHEQQIPVTLHIPGVHNVGNSLAAAAMATAAGCSLQMIAEGLQDFRPCDKRMVVIQSRNGFSLINDTYNANPGSMEAGLATLHQLALGTSMAILGDMLELGESSSACHNRVGRIAATQGVSFLALFGRFAEDTKEGALAAGMDPERVRIFIEKERIAAWVEELGAQGVLKEGDWILIKASRGMRFETIVQQLTVSP
jgi:MurE/MurF fusion protein